MKFKIVVLGTSLLFVAACGGKAPIETTIEKPIVESLDLSPYATNLSESRENTPAYISLMTPENSGVIPTEVAEVIQYFEDKAAKHLLILSQPGLDVKVRVLAMASQIPVVEIHLDKLYQDGHASAQILNQVFEKNSAEGTVFFVRHSNKYPLDWSVLEPYQVIVESEPKHSPADKEFRLLKLVPETELIVYAEKLAESKGISVEEARRAARLVHAFPALNESFLTAIESVFDKGLKIKNSEDPVLDAVFLHLPIQNLLAKEKIKQMDSGNVDTDDHVSSAEFREWVSIVQEIIEKY